MVLPKEGGDTLFSNVGAAYDELPEATKARIAGLKARHAINYERDGVAYVDEFVRPLVELHRHRPSGPTASCAVTMRSRHGAA
jgi:alpha-ketoglutarate-dependent taurine dioxygenase